MEIAGHRQKRCLSCFWSLPRELPSPLDTAMTSPDYSGYKQSGIGRDKPLHVMDKYQQIKNTYIQL